PPRQQPLLPPRQQQQLPPRQQQLLPQQQQQLQQQRRLQQQRPLRLLQLQQRQQQRRQLQLQPRHLLLAQQLQQRRQHPQLLLLAQQLRQQLRLLRQLQLKLRLPRLAQAPRQQLAQAPRQQLPLPLKLRLRQQLRRQLRQQRLRQRPIQQPQVTSAPCPTGYVRTPSGACVNLLIDFNNCGSIGYVCSSTYTSCSNGACSGAPAVQLIGGVTISGWGGTVNVDDAYVNISLPFSITLYGYTTSSASVQSNGVSTSIISIFQVFEFLNHVKCKHMCN
ncbi:unnamed protein product, partial [Rotaria magnacalcarata]